MRGPPGLPTTIITLLFFKITVGVIELKGRLHRLNAILYAFH